MWDRHDLIFQSKILDLPSATDYSDGLTSFNINGAPLLALGLILLGPLSKVTSPSMRLPFSSVKLTGRFLESTQPPTRDAESSRVTLIPGDEDRR
jgi:hypothetical protein